MSNKKVAIVGAGISSLSAARQLLESGFNVTLFEKSRGVGGRCGTRRVTIGQDTLLFDHGAQYFTSSKPEFETAVNHWVENGVAKKWEGKVKALDFKTGELTDKSEGPKRYVGIPGNSSISKFQLKELEDKHKNRIQIHLNTLVTSLRRSNSKWVVVTGDQDHASPFDAVIITTPPEQALPLVKDHSLLLSQHLSRISMNPCWSLMLAFKEKIAPEKGDGIFINNNEVISWVARNSSKSDDQKYDCWMVHTNYDWTEKNLERDPESVADDILQHFSKVIGQNLDPIHKQAHRWRYTAIKQSNVGLGEEYLFDDKSGLGIVGDYCSNSKVQGAFMSGHRCGEYLKSNL
ncbi:renalase [Acrasis kona]|uniref:Renalase n=1 Tax=Acrasis kona TaxID=1008807 RepID=A0AAW2Z3Q1_9EUKA